MSTWWAKGIAGIGVIAVIALGFFFFSGAAANTEQGLQLTHTIKRGDLIVSVTEQGTLESANNTEIKCRVKGGSTVLSVIEAGTEVKPGDELVRLDDSTIEDEINQKKITYQQAVSTHAEAQSTVAVAKIAITEYEEGTFRSSLQLLNKDLAVAQANLRTTENLLEHSQRMFKKGYISKLEVESNEYSLEQAKLELELKKTDIDVLKRFTKAKMLEELQSALKTAEAKLQSAKAALDLEKDRLDRAEEQLENCIIVATTPGMVIHPSAAEWKSAPDIEEGAGVRYDQVLLLIPDLTQMQVKVGIHESIVDRLAVGMDAKIVIKEDVMDGEVLSIATVTKPAGWWTGNVVKYDTIVKVDSRDGLKPGMSVEVKVVLAEHRDVLTIPVAAVLEDSGEFVCWVKQRDGTSQRRSLDLGDTNDQFIVVKGGLDEGDEVVLNPLAFVEEAQRTALRPIRTGAAAKKNGKGKSDEKKPKSKPAAGGKKPAGVKDKKGAKGKEKPKRGDAPKLTAASLMKAADKNSDGALTKDEYDAKDRAKFESHDTNKDGKVDVKELDAVLKKL